MKLYAGTSGYSYKEWKGTFYPEKLKNDDMLSYYGTRLNSVEINATFYRMPRRTTLEKWAAQVPGDFRFVLKASRRITHERMLKDAGDSVEYLFSLTDALGGKLGPVLFQLHRRLRCDVELLRDFLEILPKGEKAAFELQHRTWSESPAKEEVDALLAEHDAARVYVHRETITGLDPTTPPETLPKTARWGYLRLRACDYQDGDLTAWHDRLQATGYEEVFAYFKHEEEMSGPEFAVALLEINRSSAAAR